MPSSETFKETIKIKEVIVIIIKFYEFALILYCIICAKAFWMFLNLTSSHQDWEPNATTTFLLQHKNSETPYIAWILSTPPSLSNGLFSYDCSIATLNGAFFLFNYVQRHPRLRISGLPYYVGSIVHRKQFVMSLCPEKIVDVNSLLMKHFQINYESRLQ